jgi:hypothetical protein
MVPSASIPAVRQNRSKLTETASQALSTAPIPVGGKAVNGVIAFFVREHVQKQIEFERAHHDEFARHKANEPRFSNI